MVPPILPFHKTNYCDVADLDHSWNGTHQEIDGGAMDGFTAANAVTADPTGHRAMGYYDQTDLPFYYELVLDVRDRRPLLRVSTDANVPEPLVPVRGHVVRAHPQRCDRTTKSRSSNSSTPLDPVEDLLVGQPVVRPLFFQYVTHRPAQHVFPISQYFTDLNNNALPSVTFIDPGIDDNPQTENDEHPPADVQVGQKFVADA